MTKNMLKTRRMMVLISTMTGKRQVNGSRTARKWLDPILSRFCLASLICLTIGVGNVWGKEGDTHDFSQSLSQLLNNNASISGINISDPGYPIKEVIISFRYNNSITHAVTMTVSVGGSSWGSKYSAPTDKVYADSSFTHAVASGNIAISFTNNTGSGTGHGTFYVNNVRLVEGAAASDPYTVTYNAEGGTCGTSSETEASAGAGVTLPTASPSTDCHSEGWAFYGWATAACSPSTTTAPSIVGKAGDTYYPSNDITLHAVYAKGEYTKITSTGDLTSGSKYLIAVNYSTKNYILKSSSDDYDDTNYTMASAQVDETSSGKYHAKDVDNSWCYTIEGSTDSWRIRDVVNATDNYLDLAYNSWWGMAYDKDDPYKITVSAGVWSLDCHYYYNSKYNDAYLSFDETNKLFQADESTYGILLYKQTTTPSYYSTPDCIYDYFVDKVHGNEIDPKQGTYSMPASPGDEAKGDASCAEEHYHFMGWVEDVYVNRNGTLKSGYTLYPAGDSGHTAANKTFYAIWAAEE